MRRKISHVPTLLRLHIDAEFYNFTLTKTFWPDGGKGGFGWAAMYGMNNHVGPLCCALMNSNQ